MAGPETAEEAWPPPLVVRAVLALLVLVVFVPYLGGDFVWDDRAYILDDPRMYRADGIWALLSQPFAAGGAVYRPVSTVTFWLQARVFGMTLVPLRALDVLLHLGVTQLLCSALRRAALPAWAAALGAAVFAVHPGVTEVAMFVNARHDGLGALLALATVLVWTSPATTRAAAARRAVGGAALYALTLGCKESFVVLPPLVAAAQVWTERRAGRRGRGPAGLQLGTSAAVIAAFFGWRAYLQIPSGSSQLGAGALELASRVATVEAHYTTLAVTFSQGATALAWRVLGTPAVLGVAGGTIALAVGLWRWHRRDAESAARAAFGLAWFAALVAPNALAIPITGQFANRYLYVPLLGFALVLASAAHAVFRGRSRLVRRLGVAGAACLLAFCALVSAVQASRWAAGLELFGADLEDHPEDSRVVYHYAVSVVRARGCAEALPLFERAAGLEPGWVRPWHNVAGCLLTLRRYREAVTPAERAWRLGPQDPRRQLNLGAALMASGDEARGRPLLTRACASLPREPPCSMLRDSGSAPEP